MRRGHTHFGARRIWREADRRGERDLAAIAIVQTDVRQRVDGRMEVIVAVDREGNHVQSIAGASGVDDVDALIAIRGGEILNPGARECREHRVVTRGGAARPTVGLHPGLDRAIDLREARRRAGARDAVGEPGVNRKVESGHRIGHEIGVRFVQFRRNPRQSGILADDRENLSRVVRHVHHRADRPARFDHVEQIERDVRLEDPIRARFLVRCQRGRVVDDLHRSVGVPVILVAPAPLRARGERVVLAPVAVGPRDRAAVRDEHVVNLAAEAAEVLDLAGLVPAIRCHYAGDHPGGGGPRILEGAIDRRVVRVRHIKVTASHHDGTNRHEARDDPSHSRCPLKDSGLRSVSVGSHGYHPTSTDK